MNTGRMKEIVQKVKEEAKKKQQEAEDLRVKQAGTQESAAMRKDMEVGREIGKDFGLDDLGRSTDFEDVRKTRDLLNTRATEGLSQAEENAIQEKGMQQLQGAEQSQRRKLLSGLGQSGVRGGAAGQMQVELAAQAMNNRRALETDLIMQDEATKRAGETAFGNFAVSQAQFDLEQAAKEREAMLSSAMFSAEMGSTARSQMRQDIAAEKVAQSKKRGGGGSSFICTKLRELGLMSKQETKRMTKFMLDSISYKSRFLYWYVTNMKEVVDSMDLSIEAWHALKRISVDCVLQINKDQGRKAAQDKYIDTCINIATNKGVKVPSNIKTENNIINTFYLVALFTRKNTYSLLFKILRPKFNLNVLKRAFCESK